MDQEFFQKVETIFLEAVKLHGTNRHAYLDKMCAGKPELRDEVESLLEADGRSLNLLAGPVVPITTTNEDKPEADTEEMKSWPSTGSRACRRGHTYDLSLYSVCPRCGITHLDE
jgi:hypothetical protein